MASLKPLCLAAALVCGGVVATTGATPAQASPAAPLAGGGMPHGAAPLAEIEQAQYYRDRRYRRWDRRHHGPRYRHRRPGFTYYYDGYYYGTPWWGGGVVVAPRPSRPPAPVYRDRAQHVSWCLSRYRSYDAASDTFMGYDGVRRRCNSPY